MKFPITKKSVSYILYTGMANITLIIQYQSFFTLHLLYLTV